MTFLRSSTQIYNGGLLLSEFAWLWLLWQALSGRSNYNHPWTWKSYTLMQDRVLPNHKGANTLIWCYSFQCNWTRTEEIREHRLDGMLERDKAFQSQTLFKSHFILSDASDLIWSWALWICQCLHLLYWMITRERWYFQGDVGSLQLEGSDSREENS